MSVNGPQDATLLSGFEPVPASRLCGLKPYAPARPHLPIDLWLDANEGPLISSSAQSLFASITPDDLRRYPDSRPLEAQLAATWGIDAQRVVVTNGADDAIDRACRAFLEPGRALLTHTPSFEMITRSARLCDAGVHQIGWIDEPFPLAAFLEAITPGTGLIALVSPNNPTGGLIPLEAIQAIARAAAGCGAAVLVDLAYVDFASHDPTGVLLTAPNVVLTRTFSKAMGLAGLRIGFAMASPNVASLLRTVGGPYPVASTSLKAASAAHANRVDAEAYLARVRAERTALFDLCTELGATPMESHANFLAVTFRGAPFVHSALGSLGIAVRRFSAPLLENTLRITIPGEEKAFSRLGAALKSTLAPEAILFDLDGVLADVGRSYRAAIMDTAKSFGVILTSSDIEAEKLAGNANNDWELTCRLLARNGVDADLRLVIERFQEHYLGTDGQAGLRECETIIPPAEWVRDLAERWPLAIVTGRPRAEAEWFLSRAGLGELFTVRVCMEDAPAKPSPASILRALDQLGVCHAWMIGDTPDDMHAARSAGVVPIGIPAPGDDRAKSIAALEAAGAARVITSLTQVEENLP